VSNILRLHLLMYRIAFAPHALHLLITSHTYACTLDRIIVELGWKFKWSKVRQVWWSTGVKCEDANIVWIKASPDISNHLT
jgi:hypothetical protein